TGSPTRAAATARASTGNASVSSAPPRSSRATPSTSASCARSSARSRRSGAHSSTTSREPAMRTAAAASDLEQIPETRIAGRYLIRGRIGTGGMASVYRALDETTGRDVALKQLNASLAKSRRKTAEALFEREYHTLMRLKHPRIIEAYDYGLTPAGPYYT